ncbi:MAG: dihydropteroate synthase [Lachnospiraceae bacterium]|nr:dihydropteroate synthase [Lachnospiraceae bacterium]
MIIGNKEFDIQNRTYIMGILNVTPDSFSDGGSYNSIDRALIQVEKMINEGMDIVDVGGESTRPGYTQISDEEEITRVVPVIEAIKKSFDIPISVDTYKSKVAMASIDVGADLINDIWGLKYDENMAGIIADKNVVCCLMHNRNLKLSPYTDFMEDVLTDIRESIEIAIRAGIARDKIIIDPGVGFAKSYEENIKVLNQLKRFSELNQPVLLGTSRKSVIGKALNLEVEDRLEGTLATTALGVMNGCAFVRVHDVKENKRVVRMLEAVKKSY